MVRLPEATSLSASAKSLFSESSPDPSSLTAFEFAFAQSFPLDFLACFFCRFADSLASAAASLQVWSEG
jgi:hypothetical protein